MFAAYCPRHGCTVLMSLDRIGAMQRTKTGIDVRFTCQCGYTGWSRRRKSSP